MIRVPHSSRPIKWACLLALCIAVAGGTFDLSSRDAPPLLGPTRNANRKVIVTALGDVDNNAAYVGEPITYRINYYNSRPTGVDVRIVDVLDAGLTQVQVAAPGKYDPSTHAIVWEFARVAARTGGAVQFTAELKAVGVVRNQARLHFAAIGKLPRLELGSLRPPLGGKPPKEPAQPGRNVTVVETNEVTTQVRALPAVGWIPFDHDAAKGEPPKPVMKDSTTTGAMVNFDIPGVYVERVSVGKQTFYRFRMPGCASLTAVGKPELPTIGRMLEVPFGVDFSVEVVKARAVPLDAYRVYPAQPALPDVKKGDPRTTWPAVGFHQDKGCYLSDSRYPTALGVVEPQDVGVIRGHRIVFLRVNPIQTNPATFETVAYSSLEVRIKYSRLGQVLAVPKRKYAKPFEELLRSSLLNFQDAQRFDFGIDARTDDGSNKEINGCDYLILTHHSFFGPSDATNPVRRLAEWKQRKGLRVRVVDTSTITNGQTYDGLRQYLKNAYDTWTLVPSYVVLVGDSDLIPVRHLTPHPSHNNTLTGTDLYYSTLDGTDLFPDIYIGRLAVDTMAEATTAVDRILNYEQNPPTAAGFYGNVLMSALFSDLGNGTEGRPWIENVEDVRTFLIGQGYQVDRVYTTDSGWPGIATAQQPAKYENGTALPAALSPTTFGWNGAPADISAAINAGRFLATYRDHGDRPSWQANGFDTNDVDNLTNGNATPVVLDIACQNGWFDNETDAAWVNTAANDECLAEHFLRRNNGGAVAVIAASRNSWTGYNDYLMFGMHKAMWPAYVPNPATTGYPTVPTMTTSPLLRIGQIMNFGKFYMCTAYGSDTARDLTLEIYHVFGDPEMPIWTAAPVRLEATFPEGIGSVGEQHFVVKVTAVTTHAAVSGARVALTRNGTFVSVQDTDAGGIGRFKLNNIGSGNLDLTVTLNGYAPFLGSIAVSSGGARLNRLEPDNGVLNQAVHVGGTTFDGNETVALTFDGSAATSTTASAGNFGQATSIVDVTVPSPHDLGPVNILAKGATSTRYGVDVFQVRSANPVDLYLYDQWDSSTWGLHAGDNPTWDNPSIQIYDAGNLPVSSNNLVVGTTYTIRATIHNDTDFAATGAKVTFKWANFGLGQPPEVWNQIGDATMDASAHAVTTFSTPWTPATTGHLCVMAEVYHIEDSNSANNQGQENCHVGPTSSPAKVSFTVWNPTKQPAMVYLELRQLFKPGEPTRGKLWGSLIQHPDPQLLRPGEKRDGAVIIDPALMAQDIPAGAEAEFALSGFIDGKLIGGDNFRITKRKP